MNHKNKVEIMKTLILHPTDMSQWHALVYEAQASTQLILSENTESYLVFLLMRFSQTTQFLESVVAVDFLESMGVSGKRRVEQLQDVGDKSLILCGLFPGVAIKRQVGLEYFTDMGQSAYFMVSELHDSQRAELYLQLGHQFKALQQILQAMRGSD
jgi:hypothetical protein